MTEVRDILGPAEWREEGDGKYYWHYDADRFTNRSYEVTFDSNRLVRYVIVWPSR